MIAKTWKSWHLQCWQTCRHAADAVLCVYYLTIHLYFVSIHVLQPELWRIPQSPSCASTLAKLQSRAYLIKEIGFLIFKKSSWHYDGLRVALLNPLLSGPLHEDKCCVQDAVESWRKKTTQTHPGVCILAPPGWGDWVEQLSVLSNMPEKCSAAWTCMFDTRSISKPEQTFLLISYDCFYLSVIGEDDGRMIQPLSVIIQLQRVLKPGDMQITRLYSLIIQFKSHRSPIFTLLYQSCCEE